jgi:hypothetical protein
LGLGWGPEVGYFGSRWGSVVFQRSAGGQCTEEGHEAVRTSSRPGYKRLHLFIKSHTRDNKKHPPDVRAGMLSDICQIRDLSYLLVLLGDVIEPLRGGR